MFSGSECMHVVQADGEGLLPGPGRQVDDDGDELFQHGVFSELVICL